MVVRRAHPPIRKGAPTVMDPHFNEEHFLSLDTEGRRQYLARHARTDDDDPVPLTARQAGIIANFVRAASDGLQLPEVLADIEAFLQLSRTRASGLGGSVRMRLSTGAMTSDPDEAWAAVESWPQPAPGPPRAQPI
jgi:hypothetical protein